MWSSLLREYLWEAGRKKLAENQSAAPLDLPDPDVGLVFALPIECGALEDRLTRKVRWQGKGFSVCCGPLGHARVVLYTGGVGRKSAAAATKALLSAHRVPYVISAGLAGALDPALARGDVFLAEEVVDPDGKTYKLDLRVDRADVARRKAWKIGRLATADRIVGKREARTALAEKSGAGAVDMETSAVAEACAAAGVPLISVRVVSDAASEEIPPEIETLLAQKSTVGQVGAALGAIWKRPGSMKDMFKLQETALQCSDRLAEVLNAMILGMTPPRVDSPSAEG